MYKNIKKISLGILFMIISIFSIGYITNNITKTSYATDNTLYPVTIKAAYYDPNSPNEVHNVQMNEYSDKRYNNLLSGVKFRISGKDLNNNDVDILTEPTGSDGEVTIMLPKSYHNQGYDTNELFDQAYFIRAEVIPDGYIDELGDLIPHSGHSYLHVVYSPNDDKVMYCGWSDSLGCSTSDGEKELFYLFSIKPDTSRNLKITKTGTEDVSSNEEFDIKVTLYGDYYGREVDTSVNGTYGDITFTNGVGTLKIKKGETKNITNLPETSYYYKVEEINNDSYNTNYTNQAGSISSGQTKEVTIHNVKKPGSLKITKTGESTINTLIEFDVKVTLSDKTINGTYGDITFTNGVGTLKIKKNQTKNITNLPEGITYEVEEINNNGYNVSYTNNTGTIVSGEAKEVTINNNHLVTVGFEKYYYYEQKSEDIHNNNNNFIAEFEIEFLDDIPDGEYGDVTISNNKGRFSITGAGKKYIRHLPVGKKYKIRELNNSGNSIYNSNCLSERITSSSKNKENGEYLNTFSCYNRVSYNYKINLTKESLNGNLSDKFYYLIDNGGNLDSNVYSILGYKVSTPGHFFNVIDPHEWNVDSLAKEVSYYMDNLIADSLFYISYDNNAIPNNQCQNLSNDYALNLDNVNNQIDEIIGIDNLNATLHKLYNREFSDYIGVSLEQFNEITTEVYNIDYMAKGLTIEDARRIIKLAIIIASNYYECTDNIYKNINGLSIKTIKANETNEIDFLITDFYSGHDFYYAPDPLNIIYEFIPENSEYRDISPIIIDLQEQFDAIDPNTPANTFVLSKNVTITNERPLGHLKLEATKKINNDESNEEFSFELKDESGKVLQTKKNDQNGKIIFDEIEYTLNDVGKTFAYTISEVNDNKPGYTYDSHVHTINVTVNDDGDEKLDLVINGNDNIVFNNIFDAKGILNIELSKKYNKQLQGGEFSFELIKDKKVIQTTTNEKDGSIKFSPLEVTSDDIGKEVLYEVKEVKGNNRLIKYDTSTKKANVVVSKDNNGNLKPTITWNNNDSMFENEIKEEKVQTGILNNISTYTLINGIIVFIIGLFVYLKTLKKKSA